MMTSGASLRADAARNRELILNAARELFAEEGLDVSMRQIARRAGVGEPTLRRRFASKEELVGEAFADKVAVYADLADAALEHPDPAAGLRGFLEEVTRMQLVDRGFADVLTMTFPRTMRCEQHRRRSYASIQALIARSQAAGVLREDFVAEDIVLLLLAHAGVAGGAGDVAGQFSARLRAYLFSAFGLPAPATLPPAPSQARVYRALMRLHCDHRGHDE
ncbi:TetR/AcrR family transcriptional regulator [Phytohabitans suffuscus]|uniref:TetR family transcriptional regulator n=1 Tax=Phytohabitans suffuscus TaxID=624315 RepID=A0A6F8YUQ7_9ACTN|nr:TetR/AcrR family transcriptional regulator [Phytohabitans suffuscus]BCB89786.1 TetR family transcriptional regulator [Phytohabitans suffuscus]